MSETIIYLRRGRLVMLAVGSLVFVAAGFFLVTHPELQGVWEARIAGAIGIVLSMVAFFYFLSRLLHPRPALILRDDGIVDEASGVAAGFIPWSEIASVHVATIQKQKALCFVLYHPEGLLSQQSAAKRFLMQANMSLVGAPMTVPMDGLTMPGDQLLVEVEARLSQSTGRAQ